MALTSRPLWAMFLAMVLAVHYSVSAFTAPSLDTMNTRVPPQGPVSPVLLMSMDRGSQKILVKDRARVSLDRETGKITEISPPPTSDNERVNSWNAFKETVYSAAEVVTLLPSKVNPKPTPPKPVDGYSTSRQGKIVSGESPGDRLMKDYQSRAMDNEKEMPGTAFEKLKKNIYNTVDGVTNMIQPQLQKATPAPIQKTEQFFKPAVKPTFASSPVVKEALPDLQSKSPGKRWLAELKIRNWEQEQLKKKRKYEREQAAEKIKNGAYEFGDAMVGFVGSLVELPDRIKEASENIQQASTELLETVETTVETVKEIPVQVKETVETSVETTKKVVKEVQAIPGIIQAIPEKLEETVKATRDTVEETMTNVKVLVGMEQKRPAPPKVPPPPPATAQELALKVAGGVLTVTAKVAWSMTVGMTKVGLSGAKLAYSTMTEQIAQQRGDTTAMESQVVDVDKSAATAVPKEEPQLSTFQNDTILQESRTLLEKETVSEIMAPNVSNKELDTDMDALNQEVMDALELAEMAIKLAEEGKSDNDSNSELEEALRTATEAAILAANEAAEIERNMNTP